jgi:hypothetical protein
VKCIESTSRWYTVPFGTHVLRTICYLRSAICRRENTKEKGSSDKASRIASFTSSRPSSLAMMRPLPNSGQNRQMVSLQNLVALEYETAFSWSTATSSWWIWMTFFERSWVAEKGQHSSAPFALFAPFAPFAPFTPFAPFRRSELFWYFSSFFNHFFQGFIVWVSFIDREGSTLWVISDVPIAKVGWRFRGQIFMNSWETLYYEYDGDTKHDFEIG